MPPLRWTINPYRGCQHVYIYCFDHGAHYLGSNVLHLKPGTRKWYMPYLRETYPHLNPLYERLYQGVYAPDRYTEQVLDVVNGLRQRYGFDGRRTIAAPPSGGLQPALV